MAKQLKRERLGGQRKTLNKVECSFTVLLAFSCVALGRIRQLSVFSLLITYMERFPQLEVMGTLIPQVFTKVHGPHGVLNAGNTTAPTFGASTVEGVNPTHQGTLFPCEIRQQCY